MPSVVFGIGIVVGCYIGYYKMKHDHDGSTAYSVGASVVNAVIIVILGVVYK